VALVAFALGVGVTLVAERIPLVFPWKRGEQAKSPVVVPVAASPAPTAIAAVHVDAAPESEAPAAEPSPDGTPTLSPEQVAERTMPSVIYIETVQNNSDNHGQGSGFCVGPAMFVTNYHVIQNASSIGVRAVGSSRASMTTASLVKVDTEHDLALLRVSSLSTQWLGIQQVLPGIGDPIYTMSNPRGMEGTFTAGNVSAYRKITEAADPLMQISAPISPGSSGGPVLDRYGQVVGVVVATYKDAQNINFAIPAKHVLDLLAAPRGSGAPTAAVQDSAGQQQQVTLTPQELYYKGLQYLDAGNRPAALDVWNQLARVDKGLADRLYEAYQNSGKDQ
jgi:S1-C subfamily serine protease